MKVYAVGGQIRDELMGVESKDRDYVVVGSTHEEMIYLGFTQVGAAFPVYLEPNTKEEYALARTERSTGPGYHDFEVVFTPDVTIKEDLYRRDLTINAIAKDLETGEYIDPLGGIDDIKNKVLRAVSSFTMRDDPLRIYRLARLYARYGGEFKVEDDTLKLVQECLANLASLPKERKVAELQKCFSDRGPKNKSSLMIHFLTGIGEFPELLPLSVVPQPEQYHREGSAYVHSLMVLDKADEYNAPPEVKWACLCHDLGKVCYFKFGNLHGHEEYGVPLAETLSDRFGVPNSWKKLAVAVTRDHGRMHKVLDMKPNKVYDLISRINGEKNLDFAKKFMIACLCDAQGRIPSQEEYPQAEALRLCLDYLKDNQIDISEKCKEIAEKHKGNPGLIKDLVRGLKISYVRKALKQFRINWESRDVDVSHRFID